MQPRSSPTHELTLPQIVVPTLVQPWAPRSSLKNTWDPKSGVDFKYYPSQWDCKSQPHAAYLALVHGLSNKWPYLSRVTPNISHLLSPLDTALRTQLLPAVTGRSIPNDLGCALLALPVWHGGLGIRIPPRMQRENSVLPTIYLLPCDPHTWAKPGIWIWHYCLPAAKQGHHQ